MLASFNLNTVIIQYQPPAPKPETAVVRTVGEMDLTPILNHEIKDLALETLKKAEADRKAALEAARLAEEQRLANEALEAQTRLIDRLTYAQVQPNSFAYGNCTYLVAGILNIPWSGNANEWDDNARYLGYAVDGNPSIGAIAQTDAGWLGHVALVIGVDGPRVLVREMNYQGYDIDSQRWTDASEFNFIHVPL